MVHTQFDSSICLSCWLCLRVFISFFSSISFRVGYSSSLFVHWCSRSKTVLLSVSIVTFLRLLKHCYLSPLLLLSSRLKLFLLLFTLWTFNPLQLFMVSHHLSVFLVDSHSIATFCSVRCILAFLLLYSFRGSLYIFPSCTCIYSGLQSSDEYKCYS
jgi:hypothetical protein